MNKKGFTLTELLVVVAIIGILSVIIVPSVIKINSNINKRLYSQKEEYIKSAAEMYASNNPDLFNGTDTNYVYVHQLIANNYLEYDEEVGKNCSLEEGDKSAGCLINPTDKSSMNNYLVKITKKNVGIVAEIVTETDNTSNTETLVKKVCDGIGSNYNAYYESGKKCKCKYDGENVTDIINDSNSSVSQCVLAPLEDSESLDNWLKYGNEEWRVVGLYKDDGNVYAKIITNKTINE